MRGPALHRHGALLAALAGTLLVGLPHVSAAGPASTDAQAALGWLAAHRQPTGTFETGLAPLVVEAAMANGLDPSSWPEESHPALASLVSAAASSPSLLAGVRAMHARAIAGAATANDTAALMGSYRGGQFGEETLLNDDIWALRTLVAAGAWHDPSARAAMQAAAQNLSAAQASDGGWSWQRGGASSTDLTGMVLVALRETAQAAGWKAEGAEASFLPEAALSAAQRYLQGAGSNGGYGERAGTTPNCDSTVWAIRGLDAAAAQVPLGAWSYLAGLHGADGGFAYQAERDQRGGGSKGPQAAPQPSNALCTAEVATLLGEWTHLHGEPAGYGPATHSSPAQPVIPVLVAVLGLVARRIRQA